MSTYKVLQDIEAEDHILGPFSFRQFVYLLISFFFLYICFVLLTKGVAFLLILFLPFALFFGFLAFPFIKDQPTEVWALAKIRFYIKPRKRLWDQSGAKDLVTVNVPKNQQIQTTNSLNRDEVKNRLRRLSETMDTRGWAVKNVDTGVYQNNLLESTDSDRLINPSFVVSNEEPGTNDILDSSSSAVAINIDSIISQASEAHRQNLINMVSGQNDSELSDQIKQNKNLGKSSLANLPTIRQSHDTTFQSSIDPKPTIEDNSDQSIKQPAKVINSDIINLSRNNTLNLETISKEANRSSLTEGEEVVISLR